MTTASLPTSASVPFTDPAATAYRRARIAHWDTVAAGPPSNGAAAAYYHCRLEEIYRFLIPQGGRVLELGSGRGDLLAALAPARGVGVDFSSAHVAAARAKHPTLVFHEADVHDYDAAGETFDFIILSDLLNDVWDVQAILRRLRPACHAGTRVVLNFYSRLWAQPLALAKRVGKATPQLKQNWLTIDDTANLLYLTGFEVMRGWREVLLPLGVPGLAPLMNKYAVKLPPLRQLGLTNFILARPAPEPVDSAKPPTVSVIVPARNESGNIRNILRRIPEMGGGTEIVFVEGNSTDDTWAEIQRAVADNPQLKCQTMQQPGKGKGDAVRMGFDRATGDVLMILDADITVPPEDLPRFYEQLVTGRGEFVNGVRLVYPMENKAMRPLNFLGNKFFGLAFSWLLGQPIKDTLCGTKVLRKTDYERLAAGRSYFGDFDPFGDFDLLFGAAKMNLKIVDLPVRYRERVYGETNISRFSHGWLLLRMVAFAAGRIKFV